MEVGGRKKVSHPLSPTHRHITPAADNQWASSTQPQQNITFSIKAKLGLISIARIVFFHKQHGEFYLYWDFFLKTELSVISVSCMSQEIDYNKVNRCLARYSPRTTTTNQHRTKLKGKAYMWPRKHIFGLGLFLAKNPSFFVLKTLTGAVPIGR